MCVKVRSCVLERLPALSATEPAEHQRVCVSCQVAVRANLAQYTSVAALPRPVDELTSATFPDLEQVHRARYALERQVRADPHAIDAATRQSLLLEPLTLLSAHIAALKLAADRTLLGQTVLPLLRQATGRLNPSRQELDAALGTLVARGDVLGRLVTTSELLERPAPENIYAPPKAAALVPRHGAPEKAATLFRMAAWLGVLVIAAFVLNEAMTHSLGRTLQDGVVLSVFIVVLLGTSLCCALPRAIERRDGWARVAGVLMAFLFFWIISIGTVAGCFIAYWLIARWSDPATRAPT